MGMVKFWTDGNCQRVLPCNKLGRSRVRVPDRSWLFGQIHFVDLAMKRAAADAEFFRSGGNVAVGCCECLGNQSSFGLVQIERAGLFAERISG